MSGRHQQSPRRRCSDWRCFIRHCQQSLRWIWFGTDLELIRRFARQVSYSLWIGCTLPDLSDLTISFQFRAICLGVPEAVKFKLCLRYSEGFTRYDSNVVNRMIDFHQTQGTFPHTSAKKPTYWRSYVSSTTPRRMRCLSKIPATGVGGLAGSPHALCCSVSLM